MTQPYNGDKTHCIHGHAFTPDNTIWKKTKTGTGKMRVCRECKTRRDTERRRKLGRKSFQPTKSRSVTRDDLRRLVDVVWNEATEGAAVPSTDWANSVIARVLPDFP